MTRKQRRLYFISLAALAMGGAATLVVSAMSDGLVYFYTPADLHAKHVGPDRRMRIGGLVEEGSIQHQGDLVRFVVTDKSATLNVIYRGVLPDLFREGQGVVTEGKLDGNGIFHASEVLAKHDENYMPKEVTEALKKNGEWQHGQDQPTEERQL